jgi:hypothetical protein
LEQIGEAFSASMDILLEGFEEGIAGAFHKSIDALEHSMNQEKRIAELYLRDYQKIYELSKLNRNVEKSMQQTENLRAQ